MARFPGFINGTGQLASRNVNAERTVNLYPERTAPGTSKNEYWLRPTPGLRPFSAGYGFGPVRALFYEDGRCFAVSGDRFLELFADGTVKVRGQVSPDTRPAAIATTGAISRQIAVASGFNGYVFRLDTNVFAPIAQTGFPPAVTTMLFADSYILAQWSGYPRFSYSALADASSWNGVDVAGKSQSTDNLRMMIYSHKELWLLGSKTTEVWYNSGDLRNPWTPQQVLIEGGIGAIDSLCQGAESLFWLRSTGQGGLTVVRARGYNAVPIGSVALHTALETLGHVTDWIGFFQAHGDHGFYWLTSAQANQTWCYDTQTDLWHERSWLNRGTGQVEAHLARCHAYAFGKHLVGSRLDSTIYELVDGYYFDDDEPIRRVRRAPHVHSENRPLRHARLELEMTRGVGALDGHGAEPFVMLRWSDDGGDTWGPEVPAEIGRLGQRGQQVYWTMLGQSRNRVYEVAITDPVLTGIADAYLTVM